MVSGKSRIIGLVVAYLDNHFYPQALELLSNTLQQNGYHVLIFTAPNSVDAVDNLVQELMDYQVDGIIAASVSMSSTLADRAKIAGIPVVQHRKHGVYRALDVPLAVIGVLRDRRCRRKRDGGDG